MRAGLSTIQQTLMPEAANILNHAIAEARKRNHGQTTPLHVAATLLASPSGYLRQACIRSHPNSSHPLQCRALELCFSVALERLPCAQGLAPGLEPPISNALMAALKRAQAHQRRGCPEQHQQPLLAVKVELEQLIVSILDDPSVSRVMREASFSSPAVKATIEQSLNSSNSQVSSITLASSGLGYRLGNSQSILGALGRNQQQHFENGIRREDPGPRPITIAPRNLYLNPRLQQAAASAAGSCDQSGQHKEEVKKVLDIMSRGKKRNPVLVGQTEPEAVIGELLKRIEQKDIDSEVLRTVQVVSVEKELASVCVEGCDKSQIMTKFTELGSMVESRIGGGLVLNLGDLKWLLGQPGAKGGTGGFGISVPGHPQQVISEIGQILVAEMGRLLSKNVDSGQLWLIGTATCETYFRCQIYHPSMEKDWDLQVVPMAARSPHPGLFPRIGGNGIISSSVESFNPTKGFPVRRVSENTDSARRMNCCPQCMENYEQDVGKMDTEESEKSSSDAKPEAQQQQQPLPQWLQIAKPNNGINGTDHNKNKDQELILKQKREELQKKWIETCCRLHPGFHPNTNSERSQTLPIQLRQPFQPRLQLTRTNSTLQTIQTPATNQLQVPGISNSPPTSPVRTDLVLGRPKNSTETLKERLRDTTGCIPSQPQKPTHQFSGNFSSNHQVFDKISAMLDADSFKRLFKGLTERVGWQSEAAAAVATTVMQCRSGTGKRRGVGLKSDTWLMFLGFDRVGKKKMAMAVSELVFANKPVLMIKLGSSGGAFSPANEEDDMSFRGKTVLDRITETVRQNPFSVIVLEDFDQADLLVQDGLKRAMEKGRLADSHGREVSLGSVIFVLTADWLPEKSEKYPITVRLREEKLAAAAVSGCPLQLSVKTGQLSSSTVTANNKHRAEWLREAEEEQIRKRQKEDPPPPELQPALSIDLNLTAEDNETVEVSHSSRDSSDITVEHGITKRSSGSIDLILRGISDYIDDSIVFKPVDFDLLKEKIVGTVTGKFKTIFSSNRNAVFEMDDEAVEHMVGAVWFGRGFESFEEWADRVLVHGFREIQSGFPSTDDLAVRLVPVKTVVTDRRAAGDWLPGNIPVVGQ